MRFLAVLIATIMMVGPAVGDVSGKRGSLGISVSTLMERLSASNAGFSFAAPRTGADVEAPWMGTDAAGAVVFLSGTSEKDDATALQARVVMAKRYDGTDSRRLVSLGLVLAAVLPDWSRRGDWLVHASSALRHKTEVKTVQNGIVVRLVREKADDTVVLTLLPK